MIPITSGAQIGRATAIRRLLRNIASRNWTARCVCRPQGGGFELDAAATKQVLLVEG